MEIKPYSATESLSFPLPLYTSVRIGEATGKNGVRFFLFAGLDRKLAAELKTFSLDGTDTDLQNNTSDRERFGVGAYEDWYGKGRSPFALVAADTGSLAAVAWFGPKALGQKPEERSGEETSEGNRELSLEGNWHTISYRCYRPFRGEGLMKSFVSFVMDFYLKSFPGIKLWAGIKDGNLASSKLASGLGFKPNEEASDLKTNWLVMVKQ